MQITTRWPNKKYTTPELSLNIIDVRSLGVYFKIKFECKKATEC